MMSACEVCGQPVHDVSECPDCGMVGHEECVLAHECTLVVKL